MNTSIRTPAGTALPKRFLGPDGKSLQWIERTAAGEKVYDTEPETGLFKRMGVGVMSILPIEWLL